MLGEVDSQIRIIWNFKIFIHPRQASEGPIPRSSVYTTPVSFLAVLNRRRHVDEEEIATRTCLMRDYLAKGLPS